MSDLSCKSERLLLWQALFFCELIMAYITKIEV